MINDEYKKVQVELKARVVTYLTAAFGFVAGLAWNDAIAALIGYLFPLSRNTLFAKFVYAIGVTIVLVIITMYAVRLFREGTNETQ